jgi:hypothetical protein
MQFSWKTAGWKVLKTVTVAGIGVFLAAGGFEATVDLISRSAPAWAVPLLLGLVTLARNFYKQWEKSNPDDSQ